MNEKLSPQQANTEDKILRLKRDNLDITDYWILVDIDQISIVKQKSGEAPTERIYIPRRVFNRFVKFYITPQVVSKFK